MRSEHQLKGDEWDAFTGWRKVMIWRPGQRKRAKKRSHRRDRRVTQQGLRGPVSATDIITYIETGELP